MERFTEKERSCLVTYTYDLLQLLKDDGVAMVCDNQNEYSKDELEELLEKLRAK